MNNKTLRSKVIKALWTNTSKTTKQIDNSLGMIHGIGLTEYMVLSHLSNAPKNLMRRIDVAEAIGRTASGVTRMLSPMEKIGLIQKEVNPRDARVSLVKMTETGEKIFKEATNTFNQQSEQILKALDQKQLNDLYVLLK